MESVDICNEKAWYTLCWEMAARQYDMSCAMGEVVVVVKPNLRG